MFVFPNFRQFICNCLIPNDLYKDKACSWYIQERLWLFCSAEILPDQLSQFLLVERQVEKDPVDLPHQVFFQPFGLKNPGEGVERGIYQALDVIRVSRTQDDFGFSI